VRGRPPLDRVVADLLREHGHWRGTVERAEALARGVAADVADLDARIAGAVENWRLQRVGIVEQNILRIGLHELDTGSVPPKVAISESVQLAHWFAGSKAPSFVNGVLDGLARRAGRL
jgi:N utilization substance protein B